MELLKTRMCPHLAVKAGLIALILALLIAMVAPLLPEGWINLPSGKHVAEAGATDVGTAAVVGDNWYTFQVTFITLYNPATVDFTMTSAQTYAQSAMTGVKIGSFYGSGTTWTCRDSDTVGSVGSGLRTIDGLSVNFKSGDYIGIVATNGYYYIKFVDANPTHCVRIIGDYCSVGSSSSSWIGDTSWASCYGIAAGSTTSTIDNVAATGLSGSTATLNGYVAGVGSSDPTVTMYWGTTDGGTNPANWANSSAPDSPAQPQGVGVFSKALTDLLPMTTYYYTSSATNSSGTSWGVGIGVGVTTLSFTTGHVFYMDYVGGNDATTATPYGWWSVAYTTGNGTQPVTAETATGGASSSKIGRAHV